ncbi:Hypothetical predicted protein [Octopus vulgaris]|uniref:Uncharacterized protein n=1 Tax=Octopus vulgaris TaxID=6645 RepID=A0AA36BMD6_OCTVU|nr:Hypothetical predicted protein [Octopus vulgaris]
MELQHEDETERENLELFKLKDKEEQMEETYLKKSPTLEETEKSSGMAENITRQDSNTEKINIEDILRAMEQQSEQEIWQLKIKKNKWKRSICSREKLQIHKRIKRIGERQNDLTNAADSSEDSYSHNS